MNEIPIEERLTVRYSPASRFVVVLSLVVTVACLAVGSSLQRGPLKTLREELQLGFTDKVVENLPPGIAFTQAALGSFRGLAVDVLWMRAWDLRIEGRYYEMMQLSDWITQLQPRFVEVWKYHSHNLAYNLSEAVHSPEEKWMWVQEGINLLQKKGIPLNPKATDLYQQLSWIYYHRIGKYSTETHWHFKIRHAAEWHAILGAPPQGSTEEVLEWFRPVAEAPRDLDDLYQQHPEARQLMALIKKMGLELDRDWVRIAGGLMHVLDEAKEMGTTLAAGQALVDQNKELVELLGAPSGKALLAFARAKILRDEFKMDPEVMQSLMKEYGAMDWRHPHAHSAYWAVVGARETIERKSVDLYSIVQTDRMVIHSLQGLSFAGRIQFDPVTGYYNATPDPRIFDAFEKAAKEAAVRQNVEGMAPWELEEVHRGFLMWATTALYLNDTRERAQAYYKKLQDAYSAKWPGLYTKPLDDFVIAQLLQGRRTIEQAQTTINGLIYKAFNEGLAQGDKLFAKRRLKQAEQVYELFKEEQRVDSPDVDRQQKKLPPFNLMVMDQFIKYMSQPSGTVPLRMKKRVWDGVNVQMIRFVYDGIKMRLYRETRRAGYDPEKVFPEPPGMKAYREERLRKAAEQKKKKTGG